MNARFLMLLTALAAAVAAGGYHWKLKQTRSSLETERARALHDMAERRRLADEALREVAVAQGELQALLADRMNRPGSAAASGLRSPSESRMPTPPPKPPVIPPNSELRRLQVQAFVSDQRLRYAGLLKRVGFTQEKLQVFDRILGSWQQVMLDNPQSEAVRQHARETRDTQLKELFGSHYEQWVDANRNEPARAIVAEIVQKTFQGSGALTTAQAEELTRIVAQHRIPPPKAPGGTSPGYDWDRIVSDAESLLADRQIDDFIAAIEYRRATDRMSAIAAKKKR